MIFTSEQLKLEEQWLRNYAEQFGVDSSNKTFGYHHLDVCKRMTNSKEIFAICDLLSLLIRLDIEVNVLIRDIFDYTKAHAPQCIEELARAKRMLDSSVCSSL